MRGHGEYREIPGEKDFFAEVKDEERVVCHFFRENWPCKVGVMICLALLLCFLANQAPHWPILYCLLPRPGHGQALGDPGKETLRDEVHQGAVCSGSLGSMLRQPCASEPPLPTQSRADGTPRTRCRSKRRRAHFSQSGCACGCCPRWRW